MNKRCLYYIMAVIFLAAFIGSFIVILEYLKPPPEFFVHDDHPILIKIDGEEDSFLHYNQTSRSLDRTNSSNSTGRIFSILNPSEFYKTYGFLPEYENSEPNDPFAMTKNKFYIVNMLDGPTNRINALYAYNSVDTQDNTLHKISAEPFLNTPEYNKRKGLTIANSFLFEINNGDVVRPKYNVPYTIQNIHNRVMNIVESKNSITALPSDNTQSPPKLRAIYHNPKNSCITLKPNSGYNPLFIDDGAGPVENSCVLCTPAPATPTIFYGAYDADSQKQDYINIINAEYPRCVTKFRFLSRFEKNFR